MWKEKEENKVEQMLSLLTFAPILFHQLSECSTFPWFGHTDKSSPHRRSMPFLSITFSFLLFFILPRMSLLTHTLSLISLRTWLNVTSFMTLFLKAQAEFVEPSNMPLFQPGYTSLQNRNHISVNDNKCFLGQVKLNFSLI